jgi:hypothetical protein
MRTIALALLLAAFATSPAFAANEVSLTSDMGAGADAFVRGGSSATVNQTSPLTTFLVKGELDVNNGLFRRKAYIRIDRSTLACDVQAAVFQLTVVEGDRGGTFPNGAPDVTWDFDVYGLVDGHAGEAWTETTITWANAPGNLNANEMDASATVHLASFTIDDRGVTGATVSVAGPALASFVNADTDGRLTFIVARRLEPFFGTVGVQFATHSFAAREHATLAPPTLILTPSVAGRLGATPFAPPATDKPRRLGSTLPVKTHIDFDGDEITSAAELAAVLAAHCGGQGPAVVVVRDAGGIELPVDGTLRFSDPETGWICNLRLDAPAFAPGGAYRLSIRLGGIDVEGVEHVLIVR